jgi:hypothetical protein
VRDRGEATPAVILLKLDDAGSQGPLHIASRLRRDWRLTCSIYGMFCVTSVTARCDLILSGAEGDAPFVKPASDQGADSAIGLSSS